MVVSYSFLLGFISFVNLFRFSPVPSFWVQWAVFFITACFVVFSSYKYRNLVRVKAGLSLLSASLLALSFLLLGQMYLDMCQSKINALFAVVILLVGVYLHQIVRFGVDSQVRDSAIKWWAKGVLLALGVQIIAAVLLWCGKVWVPFHLSDANIPVRMFGTFGQPNQFGVFVVLALGVLIYMQRVGFIGGKALLLGWLLISILCAASGSRAAVCVWAILAVANLVQEIKQSDRVQLGQITRGRSLACLHCLFGSIQILWMTAGLGVTLAARGAATGDEFLRGAPILARIEQYRDAWQLFIKKPFLGYGFEQFASARIYHLSTSLAEPQATHTHNFLTNALVSFGLPGGLIVFAAALWVVNGAFRVVFSRNGSEGDRLAAFWALGLLVYACLEYPFEYINFFYVFLFVSAFLPGFYFKSNYKEWRLLKTLGTFSVLVGVLLSIYVALDYRRLQIMVLGMEAQVERAGRVEQPPSLEYLTRLRQQSVFVRYVDFFWLKAMGVNGDVTEQKIDVAKDLFERTPSGETISLYAANLISGARGDEALSLLCNFGLRSSREFDIALTRMHAYARLYSPIGEFLSVNQERFSRRCR